MELRMPRASSSVGSGSSSPVPQMHAEALLARLESLADSQDEDVVLSWAKEVNESSSVEMERRDSIDSSVVSELLGTEDSSFFAEIEDISVVTLPPSSTSSSILAQQGNSAQKLSDSQASIRPASPSSLLRRSMRRACLSVLKAEHVHIRVALVLLMLLSFVRPSNDGTLLAEPEVPADYVELVSRRSSMSAPFTRPVVQEDDSALPSTTTYFLMSVIGLYALVRIIRRTSAPPVVVAAGRRGRSATPARRAPRTPVKRVARAVPKPAPVSVKESAKEEEEETVVPEETFNVCLLGAEGVGVSSLLARQLFGDKVDALSQHIDESYRQAYKKKGMPTITLALCDWQNEVTRKKIGSQGLHVAVVVFALDDQASLAEAQQTVKQVKASGKETGKLKAVYLVANKSDLAEVAGPAANVRLAATRRRAAAFAEEQDIQLFECSAKTAEGVKDLFRHVARRLREGL